jgi:hypothetical protein
MSLNNFQLSLIEAEEINKIMPYPYRLESESNIPEESIKNMNKLNAKSKSNSRISTHLNKKKHRPENSEKSKSIQIVNSGKSTGLTNYGESEKKICENFYAYIENCEYCNIFFTQKYLDEPCLIDIQNKLKGRKYHRLLDIVMDLRNLCLYYSDKKFSNNINYNANQLLKYVESTYKSFYSGMNKEYKESLKMALKLNKENNKMFSEKDLSILSEQIKKLNPKQLIGLVKLIRTINNDNNDNEKYYEIDLNELDINTLNKINFYIKNIIK